MAQIVEGEIVKSKVLRVTDNAVILDVGFKSEGSVPLDEFKDPQSLKEGDEVEVFLEHLEDQEGAVVLSKKKADFMRVWEKIRVAHESDQPVEGTLVKKIKGGVVVNLMGVDAFLPGSQIALRRVPNIDELLGPDLRVQDHQAQQAPAEHRREPPGDPGERAGPQARAPDEGARRRPGAEGRGQEHHRLRRLHRPRRRGRPAPHHRHVLRPGVAPDRDGRHRQGSRGQDPRHRLAARAHQPRHEAAAVLPVAERRRQVPGRHPGAGQGRLDHQLRRVRRDRAGHRGPGPHLRDELDPERAPPVQDREHRRDHRGGGAQGGRGGGEDLARHEADRAGSVDGAAAQVPGGHPDPGQGPEPHQLRRLRRDRAGHRRPDPHLRHVLDQAGAAPVRGGQEGRRAWTS